MRFITLSNRPMDDDADSSIRRQPRMLRESAAAFGVPLENICPLGAAHDWTGGARRAMVLDYLAGVDDEEPVLLTDAWDSFFAGTPEEMEAAFRGLGAAVAIQTECNLWPVETAHLMRHPPAPTRFQYACGGGWCGFAGALRAMFTAADFWPPWACCDQAAFDDWLCRHDTARLDYHCRLFQCMYDDGTSGPPLGGVFRVEGGRMRNIETDSFPLVWHGGGGFAVEAARLWEKLKEQRGWRYP
ncbi:MAG TPA: hypothetical protein VMW52_00245 [Phycisphaerae bacterium]|nr:hypothetical protein [Phycisphaerae bacterium]